MTCLSREQHKGNSREMVGNGCHQNRPSAEEPDREFKDTGSYTHCVEIEADERQVWEVLENVRSWPEWNSLCSEARGTLEQGRTITLIPHNCPGGRHSSSSSGGHHEGHHKKPDCELAFMVTDSRVPHTFATQFVLGVPFIFSATSRMTLDAMPPRYAEASMREYEKPIGVPAAGSGPVTKVTMNTSVSGIGGWIMRHAGKEIGMNTILQQQLDRLKTVVEKQTVAL